LSNVAPASISITFSISNAFPQPLCFYICVCFIPLHHTLHLFVKKFLFVFISYYKYFIHIRSKPSVIYYKCIYLSHSLPLLYSFFSIVYRLLLIISLPVCCQSSKQASLPLANTSSCIFRSYVSSQLYYLVISIGQCTGLAFKNMKHGTKKTKHTSTIIL
jgi:hypothetical protein